MSEEYEFYNVADKRKINEEAKQVFLEVTGATEAEILKKIEKWSKKYSQLLAEYVQCPFGKIWKIKSKINSEAEQKHFKLQNAIYKQLEVNCFEEYLGMVELLGYETANSEVENIIDRLYRKEDTLQNYRNSNITGVTFNKVLIGGKFITKVDSLTVCRIKREIFCERKTHPIKNMSSEKANRFLSSSKKRLAEFTDSILEHERKIEALKTELAKTQENAKTNLSRNQNANFIQKKKNFTDDMFQDLGKSLKAYISKHNETSNKMEIRNCLLKAQKREIEKKHNDKNLVSPETVMNLLFSVYKNSIKLEKKNQDTEKGKE